MFSFLRRKAKILKIERTGSLIRLVLDQNRSIKFTPGQFISLVIPAAAGLPEVKRCYSIASTVAETQEKGLQLFIRVQLGGRAGRYLSTLKEGDDIFFYGPYGNFIADEKWTGPVCMIATGTGVAPFRSMLLSMEREQERHLIVGVRYGSEFPYENELTEAGVKVKCCTSSASDGDFNGRVTDFLKQNLLLLDWAKTQFYLCGSGEMIFEVTQILRSYGVSSEQIIAESFTNHVKTAAASQPKMKETGSSSKLAARR